MKFQLVNAGDYCVEEAGVKSRLQALLLTCVGVAIYDKVAGVGGLCHILLPDPLDRETTWQPKSYASSCLALFVDELLQKGADSNRLEAVVAGGALSLPFSQHDLNLDIGGRTAECVYRFLKRHTIPVVKSETGGCFGMAIIADTATWQVDIKQSLPSGQERSVGTVKPSPDQIRQAIANTKAIPQITLKLIRLLQDGGYNMGEIADELRQDQILSAKVISFCNKAFIRTPTQIDSIERAILVLGETQILEVIISASMKSMFEQQEGGYSLIRGGLFKHALAVAGLAKIIAAKNKEIDVQTAYTAGLLHDIGKVVLDQYVALSRPLFYTENPNEIEDFVAVERKTFATDHQQIAGELATLWKLPENLCSVLGHHHYPEQAPSDLKLVHAVYLADLLATWFMAGVELEQMNTGHLNKRMEYIGLTVTDIPEIVSKAPWDKFMYL